MPATVVVGGQYGSEGKGKVAYWIAREKEASMAVRVGGTNSGHTVVTANGERHVLRQLPTAALLPSVGCAIGPGAYIDTDVLEAEIESTGISADRIFVDPNATIITKAHKERERLRGLSERIGSTLSGTGEAVSDRVRRGDEVLLARHVPRLARYTAHGPLSSLLRKCLRRGERVVVEGTQGFGLSVLHSVEYPKATSRDTTAAAFVAEAALSPRDVDSVVLVVRAFPIRVAGNSGTLPGETSWSSIAAQGGWRAGALAEYASVTGKLRRVGTFSPEIVRAAIELNNPSTLVINHLDYADVQTLFAGTITAKAHDLLVDIEESIGMRANYVGLGPHLIEPRDTIAADWHPQAGVLR